MARTTAIPRPFVQTVRRVRAARPWVEPLARFGYAARGVVYLLIGWLAVETALGARRHATDSHGALRYVAEKSIPLLWLLAVGLLGYALWRVVQGVLDAEGKGGDPKGLAKRAAMVGTGLIYGGLAFAAARLAMGAHDSGGQATQAWTARLMSMPFGRWLVAGVGIGVVVGGVMQIRRGWLGKLSDVLIQGISASQRRLALRAGKLGLIARGVVFLIIGGFLIEAAIHIDASRARGLSGALETLARQPHGAWLLGATAVGLAAFGVYSLLLARYRRIVF
jgi:hypothetical protein